MPIRLSVLYTDYKFKIKLEIWGRAQREAARRRKSDWGTVKGLKFSKVTWPERFRRFCFPKF